MWLYGKYFTYNIGFAAKYLRTKLACKIFLKSNKPFYKIIKIISFLIKAFFKKSDNNVVFTNKNILFYNIGFCWLKPHELF